MESGYNRHVESFREREYPMLKGNETISAYRNLILIGLLDAVYLDHAGTALCPRSLLERFNADLMSNLYGNPHSASPSSQLSTSRIEDIRLKVLRFFKADPEEFDIVFVANATAGIKLVGEVFRELEGGFNYGYHRDAHTSVIGLREIAKVSRCLDDGDVEQWLSGLEHLVTGKTDHSANLFAYPARSNMDGRRLPTSWPRKVREHSRTYTLLDASALVSTSPLDLSNCSTAPDFTVLSFYKIFGFPDLGALIIRRDSGSIFQQRKYFGGGTVDVVLCVKEQWHVPKSQSLHASLEDGTLPFHSILALDAGIDVHRKLYGSMEAISMHTELLARKLHDGLRSLRHANSEPVCVMYSQGIHSESNPKDRGPIVAFNLRNSYGAWVSNTEFERLASVRNFHVRSGGLCNPGGVATYLKLEPWEMRKNFSAGFKCGAETDIYAGKITGVIRASVGAMSTISDIDKFVSFVSEFYVENSMVMAIPTSPVPANSDHLILDSITIYPIKSCGGLSIPPGLDWEVRPEGLAWDREWCLLHQGTGQALSQKRHPRMALIRPIIDLENGLLRVQFHGDPLSGSNNEVTVPLSSNPAVYKECDGARLLASRVCGDQIVARTYAKTEVNDFFSSILGTPCVLARFPAGGSGFSTRSSKAHMQKHQWPTHLNVKLPGSYPRPPPPPDSDSEIQKRPILLSNESPILAINKASLDSLNEEISTTGGKLATASVFRANLVLASSNIEAQRPYAEDHWGILRIGSQKFQMLGSCRRCHMICVDQETGEKDEEPFVTLAKTRRFESKIFFGSHMCHLPWGESSRENQYPTIRVGDVVTTEIEDV
jgi:molybdenum cofactor sulfurtransferase